MRAKVHRVGILISGDGRPLAGAKDLQAMMTGDRVNRRFELTLIRGGEVITVTAQPSELSDA